MEKRGTETAPANGMTRSSRSHSEPSRIGNALEQVLSRLDAATPPPAVPMADRNPTSARMTEMVAKAYTEQTNLEHTLREIATKEVSYRRDWWTATPEEIDDITAGAERLLAVWRSAVIQRDLREFHKAVGPRLARATFDQWSGTHPGQVSMIEQLRDYAAHAAERIRDGVGIVLVGPCGCGKDSALKATADEMIKARFRVGWINGQDLLGMFRDRISESHETEEDLIGRFVKPNILVISDPLPPTGSLTDFQATMLFRLLDSRYRAMCPTWISMNVGSREEADARMGAALVDRLRDNSLCIACNWPSFRKPWMAADAK